MGISIGDTLYITSGDKLVPALIVNNLSSVSCLCSSVTNQNIPVDHLIIARVMNVKSYSQPAENKITKELLSEQEYKADSINQQTGRIKNKQLIQGSISVNSYSDFSNTGVSNSQRFRYTLSLNAGSISGSKFSLESYISFRHKSGEWQEVKSDIFSALKIYDLAVRYDFNK
jgi:hypothetical protein